MLQDFFIEGWNWLQGQAEVKAGFTSLSSNSSRLCAPQQSYILTFPVCIFLTIFVLSPQCLYALNAFCFCCASVLLVLAVECEQRDFKLQPVYFVIEW